MKKIFVLIILFIVYPASANAQFIRGYGFKIGPSVTKQTYQYQNLGWSSGDRLTFPKSLIGLNFGIFIEILDLPYLSFPIELNYIQRGWKDGNSYYAHTLNITLLVKPRISIKGFNPYLLVGPQFDFVIDPTFKLSQYQKENYTGLILGIGSEFNVWELKMLTELNYDFYFDVLYQDRLLKVTSQTLSLRFGVMF
ncbi:MAG: PorT family protein [Ignavibacteria bacterium]|nr:PorT family protein [Ignavibacteria bacterium]